MDPADTRQTLATALIRHEQSIQITHQSVTALAQSAEAQIQQMNHLVGSLPHSWPHDSWQLGRDLNHCRDSLLECWLVFSQRSGIFPLDLAKINYSVRLLRGQALSWAQVDASHLGVGDVLSQRRHIASLRLFQPPPVSRQTELLYGELQASGAGDGSAGMAPLAGGGGGASHSLDGPQEPGLPLGSEAIGVPYGIVGSFSWPV